MEKVEYWAVVWGTGVMIATGLMLWANTLTLTWLPKSALDFATAVVIWHFYCVIFDAERLPHGDSLVDRAQRQASRRGSYRGSYRRVRPGGATGL